MQQEPHDSYSCLGQAASLLRPQNAKQGASDWTYRETATRHDPAIVTPQRQKREIISGSRVSPRSPRMATSQFLPLIQHLKPLRYVQDNLVRQHSELSRASAFTTYIQQLSVHTVPQAVALNLIGLWTQVTLKLAQLTWLTPSSTPSAAKVKAPRSRVWDRRRTVSLSEELRVSGEQNLRTELWGSAELPDDDFISTSLSNDVLPSLFAPPLPPNSQGNPG